MCSNLLSPWSIACSTAFSNFEHTSIYLFIGFYYCYNSDIKLIVLQLFLTYYVGDDIFKD